MPAKYLRVKLRKQLGVIAKQPLIANMQILCRKRMYHLAFIRGYEKNQENPGLLITYNEANPQPTKREGGRIECSDYVVTGCSINYVNFSLLSKKYNVGNVDLKIDKVYQIS